MQQILKDYADRLPQGSSVSGLLCPICTGGHSGERSLSVYRRTDHVYARCWRASCNARQRYDLSYDQIIAAQPAPLKVAPRPQYDGRLAPLTHADIDYFQERFNINRDLSWNYIRQNGNDYVFPLNTAKGHVQGHVVRAPVWSGEPQCPRYYNLDPHKPKAKTYIREGMLAMAWYCPYKHNLLAQSVVLVEDCVSAMTIASLGFRSVALLGTNLSDNKIYSLRQDGADHCIIALDPDATDKSFDMARRANPVVRTAILMMQRDPKDTDPKELQTLLLDIAE